MAAGDEAGRGLTRTVDRLLRVLALTGGAVLLDLMALTVIDVTLRYVFNAPLFGGQDIAEMALLAVVALSVAYCGRSGGHVAVDLLGQVLSRRAGRVLDAAVRLASVAILSMLVWRCFVNGLDAAEYGEASSLLNIPYLPFYFLLSAGFAIYAAVLVLEALALIARPGQEGRH